MRDNGTFKSGQRVRIKSTADSDFAGHYGVIMHVAGSHCDVRIRYKPKGSKVRSTYIGTFKTDDLESLRRPVDLAKFEEPPIQPVWKSVWVWVGLVLVVLALIVLWV